MMKDSSISNTDITMTPIHQKIEAILFCENAFISLEELSLKLSSNETAISIDTILESISDLNTVYTENKHAFTIVQVDNTVLLSINRELSITLAPLYKIKNKQRLSKALMETLSIIAYSQPITKSEIDHLRGVNSDSALQVLLAQNLIKITGKQMLPGNPNQYGTTNEFLRVFGLQSISELPKLQEQELRKFEE